MITLALLNLEARSSRVSAFLDARPELGALWRRLVAISEATASLSMEDLPVPEQDILLPDLGSSITHGDPRAARTAADINRFLKRPGDILADPGDVFDRCMKIGRLTEVVDEDRGGRIPYLSNQEHEDWHRAREDFVSAARTILTHRAPMLFRILTLSRVTAAILPERVPIAERMIFMAAESALRRELTLSDPLIGAMVGETDLRMQALWTLTPSMALSRSGFRAWSPASPEGMTTLAERLDSSLAYNVGKLGRMQKWQREIEGFSGKTGKSRRRDLARLFLELPILDSKTAADRLGMTERGARKLLDEAQSEGLITLMTQRRSYRLWSVPVLAEIIRDRQPLNAKGKGSLVLPGERQLLGEDDLPPMRSREENEASTRAALDELDRAIANADRVLAKYQREDARSR